ncbi:hypothetical protein ACFYV7_36290 [Nocardia suismassiliense]|uniref:Nitroreductase n=1 Tax=Nocardia suismassiliense TaxID=2077092 RepID=A0ABW6R448_9NOCA
MRLACRAPSVHNTQPWRWVFDGTRLRRYTDRLPMLAPQRWDDIVHSLRKLVSPHGIELDVFDERARARLSTASEQSAALRRYDMQYQAELQWWAGHHEMPEGIPPASMVPDAEFARVGVGRAFPPVPPSMRRAEIEDRARLIVFSSADDSAIQWLHTGEALSVMDERPSRLRRPWSGRHGTKGPDPRRPLTGTLIERAAASRPAAARSHRHVPAPNAGTRVVPYPA